MCGFVFFCCFFFFSSRRRHTRCSRDWSSDVCSSDLSGSLRRWFRARHNRRRSEPECAIPAKAARSPWRNIRNVLRSEERRVGKECRTGWRTEHEKKKKKTEEDEETGNVDKQQSNNIE